MANLPSGIGMVSPAGLPVNFKLPSNIKLPAGGYGFLAGLLPAAADVPAPHSTLAAKSRPRPYAPFGANRPMPQALGITSPFNPMTLIDLMNLGAGSFDPLLSGSGPIGYKAGPFGAGLPAAVGPAIGGAPAGSPLPRSGGKGVMG